MTVPRVQVHRRGSGNPAAIVFVHGFGGDGALVERPELAHRVSHLLMFGTPSFGLEKAGYWRFWKRQVSDMCVDAEFIRTLRSDWNQSLAGRPGFSFLAVAGDGDEFVPRASSLDAIPPPGFPSAYQAVIPGNHLDIVKPERPDHPSVTLAARFLVADGALGDPAAAATEQVHFRDVIERLSPHAADLDDRASIELALALEAVGRPADAIAVLTNRAQFGMDATGVLAGRLKRQWMAERTASDGREALRLYHDALGRAQTKGNHQQVFYQAINAAFLEWALNDDRAAAQALARTVLEACAQSPVDKWRLATEGEAAIILGHDAAVVAAYEGALALGPTPREVSSMYRQAMFELDLADNRTLAAAVRKLFMP